MQDGRREGKGAAVGVGEHYRQEQRRGNAAGAQRTQLALKAHGSGPGKHFVATVTSVFGVIRPQEHFQFGDRLGFIRQIDGGRGPYIGRGHAAGTQLLGVIVGTRRLLATGPNVQQTVEGHVHIGACAATRGHQRGSPQIHRNLTVNFHVFSSLDNGKESARRVQ